MRRRSGVKIFIPGIPYQNDSTTPDLITPKEDYVNAKKFRYIYVGNHYLFYRRLLINVRYIPLKNIARCYIRVDSCMSACCCASVPFDSKSLIVVTREGKEKKLWLDNKSTLDSIIEELKNKNNDIAVSYIPETVKSGGLRRQRKSLNLSNLS
jgi:hypothetical protein